MVVAVRFDVVVDSCVGPLEIELAKTVVTGFDFAGDEVDSESLFIVVFHGAVKFVAKLLGEVVSQCIPLTDAVDVVTVVPESLVVVVSQVCQAFGGRYSGTA